MKQITAWVKQLFARRNAQVQKAVAEILPESDEFYQMDMDAVLHQGNWFVCVRPWGIIVSDNDPEVALVKAFRTLRKATYAVNLAMRSASDVTGPEGTQE